MISMCLYSGKTVVLLYAVQWFHIGYVNMPTILSSMRISRFKRSESNVPNENSFFPIKLSEPYTCMVCMVYIVLRIYVSKKNSKSCGDYLAHNWQAV